MWLRGVSGEGKEKRKRKETATFTPITERYLRVVLFHSLQSRVCCTIAFDALFVFSFVFHHKRKIRRQRPKVCERKPQEKRLKVKEYHKVLWLPVLLKGKDDKKIKKSKSKKWCEESLRFCCKVWEPRQKAYKKSKKRQSCFFRGTNWCGHPKREWHHHQAAHQQKVYRLHLFFFLFAALSVRTDGTLTQTCAGASSECRALQPQCDHQTRKPKQQKKADCLVC